MKPLPQIPDWARELDAAVTVCDAQGIILYMNEKAQRTFAKQGGAAVIGRSLMDCHSEDSRKKIHSLMSEQKTNAYTIEKNGIKKMIYQAPWYLEGTFSGLIELSLEIPFEMPHFVRPSI